MWNGKKKFLPLPVVLSSTYIHTYIHTYIKYKKGRKNYKILIPIQSEHSIFQKTGHVQWFSPRRDKTWSYAPVEESECFLCVCVRACTDWLQVPFVKMMWFMIYPFIRVMWCYMHLIPLDVIRSLNNGINLVEIWWSDNRQHPILSQNFVINESSHLNVDYL
jgi:hypothetical protein